MDDCFFIEPHDVLFFRGNRLFGEAPGGGEALMPPWPSAFAGALRSAALAQAGADPADVARGALPARLAECLGTPEAPGSFTLIEVTLASHGKNGVDTYHPLPADLVVYDDEAGPSVHRLRPVTPPAGVNAGSASVALAIPQRDQRGEPLSGYWLTRAGWSRYLHGETPSADELVHATTLWRSDPRLGIGLDSDRRSAAEGALYTTEGIQLRPGVGFVVGVAGLEPDLLADDATLRLGGDGRAARMTRITAPAAATPEPTALLADASCRVVLTSPGLFSGGWRLPGLTGEHWSLWGAHGRLTAAAIPRAGTVSGWDLARHAPKPAMRAAPTGSVYWLDGLDGPAEAFGQLNRGGLAHAIDDDLASRRAEGFNRCVIAQA